MSGNNEIGLLFGKDNRLADTNFDFRDIVISSDIINEYYVCYRDRKIYLNEAMRM